MWRSYTPSTSNQPVTAYIETADFGLQTDRFVVVMLPWKLCRAFQVQIFHLELTFEHTIIITQTQISTISTVILEIDNHVLVKHMKHPSNCLHIGWLHTNCFLVVGKGRRVNFVSFCSTLFYIIVSIHNIFSAASEQ